MPDAARGPAPARPTGSCLTHLEGSLSGRSYSADVLAGTDPLDGRPLVARYDLRAAAGRFDREALAARRGQGLWRWRELLPLRDDACRSSLGEGETPMLEARRLGRQLSCPNLRIKADSLNPTGSFKARGMAVAVSRAVELGATHLVAPSAGNAGGALAAYAAAAGVPATVIMPADAPPANQVEVRACGARLVLLDGLITDCGRLAARLAARAGMFDLSTLKEPYRLEGKKTMGYELVEDLGWRVPDAIVYPTGGGTGLVGIWKALDELEELGLIGARRPRLFSVQAEGCAPIVRAFEAGARFAEPWPGAHTAAAGLRVPAAVGDFLVLDAIRRSGGAAVAVPEPEIGRMQAVAGAQGLGFVGLETAAALAGLRLLRDRGLIAADDEVVVFDTGAGLKSEPPAFEPPPVTPNREDAWESLIELAGGG